MRHVPPSPMFDTQAWVETRDAPYEMTRAAFLLHGRVVFGKHMCTVPGCTREATLLDHRVAFDGSATPEDNPGKTSVENLYPMCPECDHGKGDGDYEAWVTSPNLRALGED
jgi:5-methylcytosine-specific restriction endonuclease McrA